MGEKGSDDILECPSQAVCVPEQLRAETLNSQHPWREQPSRLTLYTETRPGDGTSREPGEAKDSVKQR